MAASTRLFAGTNVFLSRSLVPPEIFDSVHDALRLNSANVFLCCDHSRSGPDDLHVISSPNHEKFEDLKAKGCNMLGPQCILSCAKEHRALPKRSYTCCLAMEGVKVLTSGFEKDEKIKIEELVTAMGGILYSKASLDVSFVIVKSVVAAKFKWAQNILKKPIVAISWLYQCWLEHRLVPQESYKIPPFAGLTVCATRIPADERKTMERMIVQNGGKYSPDLTKKCTHLVSDAPEGDKYVVARKWGHISIVTPKWVEQCVSRRACLDEDLFPVQRTSMSSSTVFKNALKRNSSQDNASPTSHTVVSTVPAPVGLTFSQTTCPAFSDSTVFSRERTEAATCLPSKNEKMDSVSCVAADSQDDDNDLYLSDCRIFFAGFEINEMRTLIKLVRGSGATRHMSLSERITHIVVGSPSETEWKEVRRYAAWGVIKVVKTQWLEDCVRAKKEVFLAERHRAQNLFSERGHMDVGTRQAKTFSSSTSNGLVMADIGSDTRLSPDGRSALPKLHSQDAFVRVHVNSQREKLESNCKDIKCDSSKIHSPVIVSPTERRSNVFKGHLFCFSDSFPADRQAEVAEWIDQGRGLMMDIVEENQNVHFIIERHGSISNFNYLNKCTVVSSHWIRSCLEEGCMPDVRSHILYTPLQCQIPLPGFEVFRLCVSQYDEKDRSLLRNLCFVLGAKFTEKLSRKVTHLLCKFTSGPKYEAACKWGIEAITADWVTQCVMQNKVVDMAIYRPRPATAMDRESGACTMSQFPTQAADMVCRDLCSQSVTQSQGPTQVDKHINVIDYNGSYTMGNPSIPSNKKTKFTDNGVKGMLTSEGQAPQEMMARRENSFVKDVEDTVPGVSDVASVIEDLLEQSSKIQQMNPPICNQSIFPPDHIMLGQDHEGFRPQGLSKHWLNRSDKKDAPPKPCGQPESRCPYDGFSETQESQVVGYEEDLSGRQMIIDRVRSQSRA